MRVVTLTVVATLAVATARDANAQPHTLRLQVCEACTIRAKTASVLKNVPDYPIDVHWHTASRIIVLLPVAEDGPVVYDTKGVRTQVIGRRGQGPGEFTYPIVAGRYSADTLLIFDQHNARLSLLTPTLTFARALQLPVTTRTVARMPSGNLIVNARISDRSRIGLPLHSVTADGMHTRSFGATLPLVRPDQAWNYARLLAPVGDSLLWVIPNAGHYSVELWSEGGRLISSMVRQVEWYPPDAVWDQEEGRAPHPRIRALWYRDGLLWVVALVPARNWSEGTARSRQMEGKRIYQVVDLHKAFDTIIEVIDPETQSVVATARFDDAFGIDAGSGYVASVHEQRDLSYTVTLIHLSLSR